MDVENPVRPGGRKSLAEDSHEACQDDEVDPALLKQKLEQQEIVKTAIPQNISEAEPKDVAKR